MLRENELTAFPGRSTRQEFQIIKPRCFGHLSNMEAYVIDVISNQHTRRRAGDGDHHAQIFTLR